MVEGQPEARVARVRFAVTAGIEDLLAGSPGVRAALADEGVPATTLRVVADPELTVLRHNGQDYIRFATTTDDDPVAVELPAGRVVEMVIRHHPPPETIVNVGLFNTSLRRFCAVSEAFHSHEPFYTRESYQVLLDRGEIDQLRADLLTELDRIDPGASTGLWADLAWDIDMGDFPAEEAT